MLLFTLTINLVQFLLRYIWAFLQRFTPRRLDRLGRSNGFQISKKLVDAAHADAATALTQLNTTSNGLSPQEVETRLEEYGPNAVAKEKRQTWLMRLWDNVKNPLVILLTVLGIISLPDRRSARHSHHLLDGSVGHCAALLSGKPRRLGC